MEPLLFDEIIRFWYACNEKCLFCNFTPRNEPWVQHKHFPDIKNELDALIKKYRDPQNVSVFFSGGEPLLWKQELIQAIEYASEKWFWNIGIQSNVTLLTPEYVQALKKAWLQKVLVSLHAHNDEIYDQITQASGSFTRAYHGIQLLREYDIPYILNHVLNKINYQYFPQFISFLKQDGYETQLSLWVVQPHGDAYENFDIICVAYEKMLPYLQLGFQEAGNQIELITHYCDIPYCKFPRLSDDLNLDTIRKIRRGESDLQEYSKKISHSKQKVLACRECKYHSYCYGIWKKYLSKMGTHTIEPTEKFLNYLQSDLSKFPSCTEIEKDNFLYHANVFDLMEVQAQMKKNGFIFQLYVTPKDFSLDFIGAIQSGINVLNFDLSNIKNLDVSEIIRILHQVIQYSHSHQPYFSVTIFIKTSHTWLKKLFQRLFWDNIIIF